MEWGKAHMHDLKEESYATSDEPNKSSKPDKKEDTHEFHSFGYRFSQQEKYGASCSQYGTTVLESLQRNEIFKNNIKKINNKDKEIVILKDLKAICTHFPCCLLSEGELLTIEFIKPFEQKGKQKAEVDSHSPTSGMLPSKLLTFSVNTTGGDNLKRGVMRNLALKGAYEQVIVYACKGERLKDALRRDGRFQKSLFTKHCGLYDPTAEKTFEMSHLVDEFDCKSFKVKLIDRSTVLDSRSSSLEEDRPLTTCTSDADTSNVNDDSPHQSPNSTSVSAASGMSAQEATSSASVTRSKKILHEISDSGEVYQLLCSQFKDLVKLMKDRHNLKSNLQVQQLFTEEYGKSVQTCLEMKRVRELTVHGESVCQVRVNGSAMGSGFLLFGRFILTNYHVIKDAVHQDKLWKHVTATFDFEDLSKKAHDINMVPALVAYEYGKDYSGNFHDMALLELDPDPGTLLPPGLLEIFAFPPLQGGICIIGHPGQGVKKIDPCCIISPENRPAAVKKHGTENTEYVHLITKTYLENNSDLSDMIKGDGQKITYDTCFYHGSSGSPVFDEHCNVIAMHSGGYHYKNAKGKTQSVIEYAYPLSLTLTTIMRQAVDKKRADVLQSLKECLKTDKNEFFKDLKTLEGENLTYYDLLFNRIEPMDLDE